MMSKTQEQQLKLKKKEYEGISPKYILNTVQSLVYSCRNS